jgi:predicted transcriptional regulator
MTARTQTLSFRITKELKAALERLAAAERRSVSTYVIFALEEHVGRVEKQSKRRSTKA